MRTLLSYVLLAVTMSACTQKLPVSACVDGKIALLITVRDSLSGSALANATIHANDQSVTVGANPVYPALLGMHAGSYAILIQSSGYADWSRTVNVTGQDALGCMPNTVAVTALMQRTP